MLTLRKVGLSYGPARVLDGISAEFRRSTLTTIVGPNGAGKSTLLGILAGLKRHHDGEVLLEGRPIEQWKRAAFARKVGLVPQSVLVEFPFTVEQVVLMGRTPHGDGMFETEEDHRAADQAMADTDTQHLRGRDFRSLSGGERQRVILASVLAQQPEIMLLDEPTTFLDLKHQIAIYQLLRKLANNGLLVISVTHDLNLAALYSDRILVLCCGQLIADDKPEHALSASLIRRVFEVEAESRIAEDGSLRIHYGR